jgi:methyl-accepting chemotaxis protein
MQATETIHAAKKRQFGVGFKITAGYVAILLILIVIAALLLINLDGLLNQFKTTINVDFTVIEQMKELELLIVDMETGERGFLITGGQNFLEPYNTAVDNFTAVSQELLQLVRNDPKDYALVQEIITLKDDWLEKVAKPMIALRQGINGKLISEANLGAYNDIVNIIASGTGKERMDKIHAKFAEFTDQHNNRNNSNIEQETQTVNSLKWLVIAITGVGLAIGLGLSSYLGRTISRNVRSVMAAAQGVASGDLKRRAVIYSNDEVSQLAEAFNTMASNLEQTMASQVAKEYLENIINEYRSFVARVSEGDLTAQLTLDHSDQTGAEEDLYELGVNLNRMVEGLADMATQIHETAAGVSSSAAEILAATTQQIASATEQDAAVTQTMTTVEELRATVRQTADRAQGVAQNSRHSVEVSRNGQDAVSDSVNGMKLIRERVESIAENILMLSERTMQIGEIIDTVNEIASQSKLLALNASIEAARAGEEGQGFAVVAMEVRQLAEQSREATARVRDILNQIQQATNTAVMVTEEGSKGAESGVVLVERAGDSISDLTAMIEDASQAAIQIAASTNQQTNGMDQLSTAMVSIKQATTQTAASTRQAELSAQDLNQLAHQMLNAVARYQLKREPSAEFVGNSNGRNGNQVLSRRAS